MDEVGRGALAGPVTVGVAVVGAATSRRLPHGLADSKLLTAHAREDLVEPIRRWCAGSAVGHASAAEIDELGIIAALRLAGRRALAELAGAGLAPAVVVLDGVHNWLSAPEQGDLFAPEPPEVLVPGVGLPVATPPVRTQVKADMTCAVVAAASVLAKVERDRIMVGLDGDFPAYRWASNKGYSAPEHVAALHKHGACELHRRSWHLPGLGEAAGAITPPPEACEEDAEAEAYARDGYESASDDGVADEPLWDAAPAAEPSGGLAAAVDGTVAAPADDAAAEPGVLAGRA
ncbi:ribonuclease HII [Georgenia ruanii]|uniref:Ribonuclease n=2 Tax=Georgenia ruanii TaxID=348442 RepID=A0A7J9URH8_9MICO|nr:ribonuclease HII [Georgenia ruanii]